MLEGIPLDALGPLGIVLAIMLSPFYFMARGKLVPRSFLEDERADTERWRVAHEVSEAARAAQSEQIRALLTQSETTVALLRSITERKT